MSPRGAQKCNQIQTSGSRPGTIPPFSCSAEPKYSNISVQFQISGKKLILFVFSVRRVREIRTGRMVRRIHVQSRKL